ncbi:MAG: hypothetical protein A3K06_00085 [Candidatus Doudnabacteria bacterium RIFCSPHIGHO2_01_52_17]|uniref:Ribosomal RNA adenine methylase transferase N-terminal domain-containing protein n=1 Tax=Candidatus Doudnabacteria bacterium RIFCSPHIGHO2_01_52_17 TaxID=1817820 RepID=A0A1F5N9Y9_9BACT|nr:MAG: hypothetical protein A3K06_00085 [Candidatus Doudnabacteria bacterium RIFCSPHIGHO2_01_52_17]
MVSEQVLDEIIAASELRKTDQVLEIGAGLGVLTRALAEQAGEVIAVEKDRQLARALRQMFRNNRNVKIIQDDALFFDPADYNLQPTTYKLVANLPYYITGAILEKFLATPPSLSPSHLSALSSRPKGQGREKEGGEIHPPTKGENGSSFNDFPPHAVGEERWGGRPSLMVLLLQKEVAERIVAKPGDMSILSVSVQLYSDPEIISYVGKENFYPTPEVDSAIVRLRVLPEARFQTDEQKFFGLVKIGFSNKRKQLHNNLQALPPPFLPHKWGGTEGGADYKKILQDLGLNPLARAQDLSLQDWYRLYQRLNNGRT